jgi:hypothetical protein
MVDRIELISTLSRAKNACPLQSEITSGWRGTIFGSVSRVTGFEPATFSPHSILADLGFQRFSRGFRALYHRNRHWQAILFSRTFARQIE